MGFRVTLNFRKFKVALNPMYGISSFPRGPVRVLIKVFSHWRKNCKECEAAFITIPLFRQCLYPLFLLNYWQLMVSALEIIMIEQTVDIIRWAITTVRKEAAVLTVILSLRIKIGVFILQVSEDYFYVYFLALFCLY